MLLKYLKSHNFLNVEVGLPLSIAQQADKARDWLVSFAYPLWFSHGVDWKQGGFFDSLDIDSGQNAAEEKRLRVAARQIYVFSQASRLGFEDGVQAVVHGLKFLFGSASHRDGAFASSFDLSCKQTSNDRDTYDLAFVLFALAHAYHLLNDENCLIEAERLLEFFNATLRHPRSGFVEGLPPKFPRRQNPHMHLLEACIAWLPYDRSGSFHKLADELVLLFETTFIDAQNGAILEYFNDALQFSADDVRDAVEPGHLFEWFSLLSVYNANKTSAISYLPKIYTFARHHSMNQATGLLFGELGRDGSVRDRSVRLWPHAEWVRAEVIYLSQQPDRDLCQLENALSALWRFLDAPTQGLWFERFDSETNQFHRGPAAASSLYHIVGAFSALMENQGRI